MKKLCAEFDTGKKACSMTINEKKVNCDSYMIGSYMYDDAEGKKQTCSYASFNMKDKDQVNCDYMLMHDTKSGQLTLSKSGSSVLASVKSNIELANVINKVSAFFNSEPYAKISIDKMLEDVFEMNSPSLPTEEDVNKCKE